MCVCELCADAVNELTKINHMGYVFMKTLEVFYI